MCLILFIESKIYSQVAAEEGRGIGPGAGWLRPSPGPPGSHCGQSGTDRLQGSGCALQKHQHLWHFLRKQVKVLDLSPQAVEYQPISQPLPLLGAQPHLLVDCVRDAAPQDQVGSGRPGPRCLMGSHPKTRENRMRKLPTWVTWLMRLDGPTRQ